MFLSVLQPRNQENILRESLPSHLVDEEVLAEEKVG
jgi:tRNA A22 N-methylase